MKIYYQDAETSPRRFLVGHMKPYLVTLPDKVEDLSVFKQGSDSIQFSFERFLKFEHVSWYDFDNDETNTMRIKELFRLLHE